MGVKIRCYETAITYLDAIPVEEITMSRSWIASKKAVILIRQSRAFIIQEASY